MDVEAALSHVKAIKGFADGSAEEHALVLESSKDILRLVLLVCSVTRPIIVMACCSCCKVFDLVNTVKRGHCSPEAGRGTTCISHALPFPSPHHLAC